jgi:hypothetical protein
MATAPYGVRLLVGAAVTALEETRKLPQTILMYPMTVASQVAHLVMKMQQDVADLVIKGDETLEQLFPPKDEQPEWATFDEDFPDAAEAPAIPAGAADDGDRLTEGRFALYSVADAEALNAPANPTKPATKPARKPARKSKKSAPDAPQPEVVAELDYPTLTLAQLRARLQSLSVEELEALLAYEQATKARAPFQTLLANRITRANAK